jgi:polar amino acid transport system substrate-binding protein
MLKKIVITLISASLMLMGIKPAMADTIIENVARTGKLTVGTSFDLIPYAYYNEKDELVGYSIDIVKLIQQELEKELSRPVELNFVEANTIEETIPKMMMGEIDIACNKVFTWERDKYVDYTIRYSVSGIRLLIPKNSSLASNDSWAGKKIGIPPLTFVEDAIQLAHPDVTLVEIETVKDGVKALQDGTVDALAGDVVILDGVRQEIDPDGFEFFPKFSENPYARYGVACIVPQNNSAFLHIANKRIAKMMEGYIIGDQESVEMVNKWIGPEGVVNKIDPNVVKDFYQNIMLEYEQIPFSGQ